MALPFLIFLSPLFIGWTGLIDPLGQTIAIWSKLLLTGANRTVN
jgi:hypothetical protein